MSTQKRLDRERLEAYCVYLLLSYRPLIFVCGLVILIYSLVTTIKFPVFGGVLIIIASFLILLGSSFQLVLFTARLGAWIATLGRNE